MPGFNEFTGTNDFPLMSDLPWGPNLLTIGGVTQGIRNQARQQWLSAVEQWRLQHNIPNDVWQAWNDANAARLLSEIEVKDFWQKAKEKVQAAIHSVGNGVDEVKSKALMLLFAPLVPIAKMYLKRRGITPADKPEDIVKQVYSTRNTQSFGYNQKDTLDNLVIITKDEKVNYGLEDAGEAEPGGGSSIPSPEMIKAVISLITSLIDSIRAKKSSGQPLSADEQAILTEAPKIQEQLDKAQESVDPASKSGMNMKIGIAILILIALWFFLRRR